MAVAKKLPNPVTVDFETFGIGARPTYPPMPVGVSIKPWGKPPKYYSWGHLTKNNCSWDEARAALVEAYNCKDGVLFQNGKFDVDVAEVYFDLKIPKWDLIHDTMFLLFLDDPHQLKLDLKSAATRLLDEPPEERDEVVDWLVDNQPVSGVKISRSLKSENGAMGFLPFAPGELVGKYADSDTKRTEKLFRLLYPKTVSRKMIGAYNRERELMPILLEMERQGLPVDLDRLRADVAMYRRTMGKLDEWIVKRLKIKDPKFNIDSGEQLINAAIAAGKADEELIPLTATGKLQTNKEALAAGLTDPVLTGVLKYRSQLKTCLSTFMEPWLAVAERSGGLIYTTWNQTKTPSSGGSVGTRTGRLSSTPNFQNIPNEFYPIFRHEEKDSVKAKKLPVAPLELPPLPKVRGYVTAPDGYVLCGRDFSSQELRVLAHFEDGAMKEAYIKDSKMDFHQQAADLILSTTGIKISRKAAKTIAFAILYGSGLGTLAEGIGCSVEEAKKLRNAYLGTFPGIKMLQDDLKQRSKQNLPIRTWGGREYYCEPPKLIDGRIREFSYKMLNYLIQGSSADQTKEAIIKFYNRKPDAKLLISVHDEILILCKKNNWKEPMDVLRHCMNNLEIDVPVESDGEVGKSWASMEECH